MVLDYETPFREAAMTQETEVSTICSWGKYVPRWLAKQAVQLLLLGFWMTLFLTGTACESKLKLKVELLWEKSAAQNIWKRGESQALVVLRVTYEPQKNMLLITYGHRAKDSPAPELVIEILDGDTGDTLRTIVCEDKKANAKGPGVIPAFGMAGSFAAMVEEGNTVLVVNHLTLRTFDMAGRLQASLDLPQRQASWLAVYMPELRKVFLFDPVRKTTIKKGRDEYDNWDFDLFEVQTTKASIKLRKIVSFVSREYRPIWRQHLYVCPTCQRNKLVWLQRLEDKDVFQVYDPVTGGFEADERKLPPHIDSIVRKDPLVDLIPTLWLDTDRWRWLHVRRVYGTRKGDANYFRLDVWSHEETKSQATVRAPNVEGTGEIAFDRGGTLCALFGDYTTCLIDVSQGRIVSKWLEKQEDVGIARGLLSPDGAIIFLILYHGKPPTWAVKVRAYKLVLGEK